MLKRPLAEINIVPYVDVMLVLLVIFMITTPLLTKEISIKLPQENVKTFSSHKLLIVVSVDNHGNYFLNIAKQPERSIPLQNLVNEIIVALRPIKQKQEVYIKGDKEVNYGKVIQVMTSLQQAGISNVGLVIDENNKEK